MTQETAKSAADTAVSTDKSTDQPTNQPATRTLVVANDGKEADVSPTITFSGNPGSRRIRVEGMDDAAPAASYNPDAAPSIMGENPLAEDLQEELEALRAGLPETDVIAVKPSKLLTALRAAGIIGSAAWLAGWTVYGIHAAQSIAMTPADWAAIVAAAFTPVAVVTMGISQFARGSEVRLYAGALRRELQTLLFPSEERAVQVNKDIEKLTQQAAELAVASKATLKAVHRARQGLRLEMREFATL